MIKIVFTVVIIFKDICEKLVFHFLQGCRILYAENTVGGFWYIVYYNKRKLLDYDYSNYTTYNNWIILTCNSQPR